MSCHSYYLHNWSTRITRLSTHSSRSITLCNLLSIRLFTRSTRLFTRVICLFTRKLVVLSVGLFIHLSSLRELSEGKLIFNYHFNRAMVENAFGVLDSQFRIFLSPISVSRKNAEKVVLASCVLHNYLCTKTPLRYTPNVSFDNVHPWNEIVQPGS